MPVSEDEDERRRRQSTRTVAQVNIRRILSLAQKTHLSYTPAPPVMQKENPVSQQQQTGSEVPRPGVDAPGAFPETPAETLDELYSHYRY